ncbi:hypothetical protein [Sphingobacterium phlebotomi]|nr:hypothetical protein [Sphingobacterium phlebotomi]
MWKENLLRHDLGIREIDDYRKCDQDNSNPQDGLCNYFAYGMIFG